MQECLVMGGMRQSMLQGNKCFVVLSLEGRLAVYPYTARLRCCEDNHPRCNIFEVLCLAGFLAAGPNCC